MTYNYYQWFPGNFDDQVYLVGARGGSYHNHGRSFLFHHPRERDGMNIIPKVLNNNNNESI